MGLLDKVRGSQATDPVCDMKVDTRNPPGGTHAHEGTTFYFCSAGCRQSFAKDPLPYLRKIGHGGH